MFWIFYVYMQVFMFVCIHLVSAYKSIAYIYICFTNFVSLSLQNLRVYKCVPAFICVSFAFSLILFLFLFICLFYHIWVCLFVFNFHHIAFFLLLFNVYKFSNERERKYVNLSLWEVERILEAFGREEVIIRIYCMKKLFKIKKYILKM